ncbi:MAG: hypothetical protein IJ551_10965 [Prevotella sp.]|nr:hypothetical protein [Prevotella sp.]
MYSSAVARSRRFSNESSTRGFTSLAFISPFTFCHSAAKHTALVKKLVAGR